MSWHAFGLGRAGLLSALLAMSACATIVEGTGQNINLATTPTGASCEVSRDGKLLGTVPMTPGTLRIDKSGKDLTIVCSKDLHAAATSTHSPKFVDTTFGNILLGGLVGVVVDASTGANYTHADKFEITLNPIGAAPPAASPPAAAVAKPTS
jgi:hypothetical protein